MCTKALLILWMCVWYTTKGDYDCVCNYNVEKKVMPYVSIQCQQTLQLTQVYKWSAADATAMWAEDSYYTLYYYTLFLNSRSDPQYWWTRNCRHFVQRQWLEPARYLKIWDWDPTWSEIPTKRPLKYGLWWQNQILKYLSECVVSSEYSCSTVS